MRTKPWPDPLAPTSRERSRTVEPITVELPRFESMHGWANRILRVDLSDVRISAQETAPHKPDYLGARGIVARVCWDEYPEPVEPYDPANPLMVFPGALTGSHYPTRAAPTSVPSAPRPIPTHGSREPAWACISAGAQARRI